ncbi:MAG: hypothetical protein IJ193_03890 [Bacilli bacterium]|nr:hypothetical protein [Bacilli bacterium]
MSYVIRYIIPLIYWLTGAIFISSITKKKIKDSIPLIFFITPFLLYGSVLLCNSFDIGMILSLLLSIFGMIFCIKNKKELFEKENRNTILFFIGIYTFFFLFDLNRKFSMWDEWSHWGEMVKEMLRLDNLYSIKESTLMVHKDYPPLVPIMELFLVKLTGVYKESLLIHSIHVMEFSLLIPFLEKIKGKIKYGIPFLILLILNILDHHHVLNCIYLDYLLSIIVIYILGIILFEKKSAYKQGVLLLSILYLLLTKEISILFYPVVIGIYFGKEILEKSTKKELLINIFLLIIIPITVFFSYQQYKNNLEVEKQFSMNSNLLSELTKEKESYQVETINHYKNAIIKENITNSYLPISTILLSIISIGVLLVIIKEKKERILVTTFFLIEIIGYGVVLLYLYVYQFGPSEGPALASFDRYMATILLIPIVLGVIYKKEWKIKEFLVILLFLIIIQRPDPLRQLVPALKGYTFEYETIGYQIKEQGKENKKVFLLAEESGGEYQYPVKYYANPIITNKEYYEWVENPTDIHRQELEDYLKEFDYFYIIRIRENTKNTYSNLLESIEERTLYRIKIKEKKINFEKVET